MWQSLNEDIRAAKTDIHAINGERNPQNSIEQPLTESARASKHGISKNAGIKIG